MVAIPVVVLIGVILILVGLYFFLSDQFWFLSAIIKQPVVCSPSDVLITFLDPTKVLKDYFCHSA